jgi:hypothetical protein
MFNYLKSMLNRLKRIAINWAIPPAVKSLLSHYSLSVLFFYITHRYLFRTNLSLRNCHVGERCFILCNGPSVKEQDIKLLRGEIVLTVSNGYRHPDFLYIQPKYHFVPHITYSVLSSKDTKKWFKDMHQSIGAAELFLSWQEWSLVKDKKLFKGRKVNYLCMGKRNFTSNGQLPNIASIIPICQSAPIMALMTALYMGFEEIYLLGVEHDWFIKKEYKYFFDGQVEGASTPTLSKEGGVLTTLWDELPVIQRLLSQYRAIKHIAKIQGTTIYNATQGGVLDEFERVKFESVIHKD